MNGSEGMHVFCFLIIASESGATYFRIVAFLMTYLLKKHGVVSGLFVGKGVKINWVMSCRGSF